MKIKLLPVFLMLFLSFGISAQETTSFYATMSLSDAENFKKEYPDEIEIIAQKRNEAAVYLSSEATHLIHERVLVHGPGYIFKASREDAIRDLEPMEPATEFNLMNYTITEDAIVNSTLNLINTQNIEDHILELVAYGTRYHNRPSATQSAIDLKAKWEAMAAAYNRTDVSVRLYDHVNTGMPSVILTIQGAVTPEEFVVVGGHLDSTAFPSFDNAPGADDDASGIATMTEAVRAIFEYGFTPDRTIEMMAYAAEEIGLVGSAEIAQQYNNDGVNVISAVQFDMTNFNGSANDIVFITDDFSTDQDLTNFLMELIDHYNSTGDHVFTYGTSLCNYGCSDHASWTNAGYPAAFPFEATFDQSNDEIHSANDVFSVSGDAVHATKFAKLCVEYLIETAKGESVLSIPEVVAENFEFSVVNQNLMYRSLNGNNLEGITIYDALGKQVKQVVITENNGVIALNNLSDGVYIASVQVTGKGTVTKKFILK